MSETNEPSIAPIDELLADFVIKKISKKEKKSNSKHKKHKRKKSKGKHKHRSRSRGESELRIESDRKKNSSDELKTSPKSKHSKKKHKHKHRSSTPDSYPSQFSHKHHHSKNRDIYNESGKEENGKNDVNIDVEKNHKSSKGKKKMNSSDDFKSLISTVDINAIVKRNVLPNVIINEKSFVTTHNNSQTASKDDYDPVPMEETSKQSSSSSREITPNPEQAEILQKLLKPKDLKGKLSAYLSDDKKDDDCEKNKLSFDNGHQNQDEEMVKEKDYEKGKKYDRHRSTSRENSQEKTNKKPKHSRDRSRGRKRSKDRGRERSCDRGKDHSHYQNGSPDYKRRKHSRDRSRDRKISDDRSRGRKRSRDRSREYKYSKRSNSRERRDRDRRREEKKGRIDKEKLLEVARKNVLTMIERGTLPQGIEIDALKRGQFFSLKSGGTSVAELTDFCRTLSEKEKGEEDEIVENLIGSKDDNEPFIHHPFKIKEPTIKLNIKNSTQIPIKSNAENTRTLSLQFPVSSGDQHRQKELEWIPVEPDNKDSASANTQIVQLHAPPPPPPPPPPMPPSFASYPFPPGETMLNPPLPPLPPMPPPPLPQSSYMNTMESYPMQTYPLPSSSFGTSAAVPPPPLPASLPLTPPSKPQRPLNLSAIVSKRYKAIQKLQSDPSNAQALKDMEDAQKEMQVWVQSQQVPGQFTGSTNAKVLSVNELSGPRQAWVKKDIFTSAAPVTEGKGMSLLRKMGWKPGEGLGKNKEGVLEPLFLDIKMDKKGLIADADKKTLIIPISAGPGEGNQKIMIQGKHPVSILMELCSKQKWPPPIYTEVIETGPSHKRLFLFKVQVNDVEYQPAVTRNSKKLAKADAALVCLKYLGEIPDTTPTPIPASTLTTVPTTTPTPTV